MKEAYLTVAGRGTAEIVEKKSQFIANVSPAKTEQEALSFLETIRKANKDAAHNVFAYVIENDIIRFSDDGEPGGTAGQPVLSVLTSSGVKNAIIVVTRYFGGTLLGAGGLVRAYSQSAKLGLNAAGIVEMRLHRQVSLCVPYTLAQKIQYELQKGNYYIDDTTYMEDVTFCLSIQNASCDEFVDFARNLTNGLAEVTLGELVYRV